MIEWMIMTGVTYGAMYKWSEMNYTSYRSLSIRSMADSESIDLNTMLWPANLCSVLLSAIVMLHTRAIFPPKIVVKRIHILCRGIISRLNSHNVRFNKHKIKLNHINTHYFRIVINNCCLFVSAAGENTYTINRV